MSSSGSLLSQSTRSMPLRLYCASVPNRPLSFFHLSAVGFFPGWPYRISHSPGYGRPFLNMNYRWRVEKRLTKCSEKTIETATPTPITHAAMLREKHEPKSSGVTRLAQYTIRPMLNNTNNVSTHQTADDELLPAPVSANNGIGAT